MTELRDFHEALAEADRAVLEGTTMTGNRHDYRITDKGIVYDETIMERFMNWVHASLRKAINHRKRGAR